MKNGIQNIMMAVGLAAVVAGFSGCASSDRSSGRAYEDWRTSRRIKSALNDAPMYKFGDVSVDTFKGVAQLNGWVDSDSQRSNATQIARSVPGVNQVINNLTLKPRVQTEVEIPSPTGPGGGQRIVPGTNPEAVPGQPPAVNPPSTQNPNLNNPPAPPPSSTPQTTPPSSSPQPQ